LFKTAQSIPRNGQFARARIFRQSGGVGERFLRNPPGIAMHRNALFSECLAAHPAGYSANDVHHPPYIQD
jgi:hypothetical protein